MKKENLNSRKGVLSVVLLLLLSVVVTACSPAKPSSGTSAAPKTETEATGAGQTAKAGAKIGIVQLIEHPALDAANQGFLDGLKAEGLSAEIDFQNAQGDQSNLKAIADRFVANKVDLILAIATPSAQTVAATTSTIPVIGTAITDYVGAKLAESNEKPGRNVTGTSDMNPIEAQIDLIKEVMPKTKTLGLIYTSSEINSEIQAKAAEKHAKNLGWEVKIVTISNVNDLQQAATGLVSKVDAIYVPTDNVIAAAMPILSAVTDAAKIPVFCGEGNMVKSGGLATVSVDYYKLGKQSAVMAARILRGEAKAAEMAIEMQSSFELMLNQAAAKRNGLSFPESLLKKEGAVVLP